jgi:pyrimidine-nucleoside phosphorylase
MRAVDIIAKKRDGHRLSPDEIRFFVDGFVAGDIPDYQAAALLMAIVCRGMNDAETLHLTMAMARSGDVLDLSAIAPVVVDKHSTGGVGDKTTIAVAPIVTATGLRMAKMSGRGLGITGGTLDKLESIPGFQVEISQSAFLDQVRNVGLVVASQTGDLVPADGKLYALRDVTATIESVPLIASSIMSKKIASGADAILLDVKVGRGAFMHTNGEAADLAYTMVRIGRDADRNVTAVVSDMSQPLGRAVGNAVEVAEAIATLHGQGPPDFAEHCTAIAAHLLVLGGQASDTVEARHMVHQLVENGAALDQFRRWVAAQGGDPTVADNPTIMPQAEVVRAVEAPQDGYIAAIDARTVGYTAVLLGAGREKKGTAIDHSVGIVLGPKVGDRVKKGMPLLTIHAASADDFAAARQRLLGAYKWGCEPVEAPPLIHRVITQEDVA